MISIFFTEFNTNDNTEQMVESYNTYISSKLKLDKIYSTLSLPSTTRIIRHGYYKRKLVSGNEEYTVKVLRLKLIDENKTFIKTTSIIPHFLLPNITIPTSELFMIISSHNYEIYLKTFPFTIQVDEDDYNILRSRYLSITKKLSHYTHMSIKPMSLNTLKKLYTILTSLSTTQVILIGSLTPI